MIETQNLTRAEQAKVGEKLAELQKISGHEWTYEIMHQRQLNKSGYLLEVAVDGRIQRPVSLSCELSVERICGALESLHKALKQ